MKRTLFYVLITVAYLMNSLQPGFSSSVAPDITLVHVGRITSIDELTHTVLLRGVSLSEEHVDTAARESKVLFRGLTRIVYNGSRISFTDLKPGDFIRVSGAMSGRTLVAGEVQKYATLPRPSM